MKNYETAAIKITPAELTRGIAKNAAAQHIERLKTERVELRTNERSKNERDRS